MILGDPEFTEPVLRFFFEGQQQQQTTTTNPLFDLADYCSAIHNTDALEQALLMKFKHGNTPLHLVAEQGDLRLCKELVRIGARAFARNGQGRTPQQLAAAQQRKAFSSAASKEKYAQTTKYLEGLKSVFRTGAGNGAALAPAKADGRFVIAVKWMRLPLPGWANKTGAFHSLLVFTVGSSGDENEGSQQQQAQYVIEKFQGQEYPKGVFVSSWEAVKTMVGDTPMHELSGPEEVKGGLTMASLYDLAIGDQQQEYSAANCNCHHMALLLFNACVAPAAQDRKAVASIPNKWQTDIAKVLRRVGVDVEGSGAASGGGGGGGGGGLSQSSASSVSVSVSTPIQLNSASLPHHAQDATTGKFPLARNCPDESHRWAAVGARLSNWIYMPKDDEFTVVNCLGRDVELRVREDGGGSGGGGGGGKARSFKLEAFKRIRVPLAGSSRSAMASVHVPGQYYGTTTLVAPSAAEARCAYRVHDPSTVERELPVSFDLTKRQDEGLFPHAECALHGEVRMADDENPVQWAVATCKRDEGTVMVVFRGSDNPLDIVTSSVDACMFIKDLGLRANSRLWGALHSSEHGASRSIIRALTSDAELKGRAVVVCGHSLGGAYATLFALELLKRGVAVRSVASFGGPQVVVPKPDNELWRSLNEVATVYVNEFDAIPRLPSCERWVFDAVPSIAHVSAEQTAYLREKWSSLEKYRHIGRLLFIGDGRDHAMRVHEAASDEQSTAPHMAPQPSALAATAADLQVRGAKPGMLVAHHFGYSAVTAQLTVSEAGTDGGGEAVARLSVEASEADTLAVLYDKLKEAQAHDAATYASIWSELEAEDPEIPGPLMTAVKSLVATAPALPPETNGEPGKPRQHEDISTVEALLSAADVAGPLLHEIGRDLAEKHGGEYKGAPTKGEVRVREKVKNDYGGDVRCIVDAARGSLVFSTLSGLLAVVEELVAGSSSAAAAPAGATQLIIVRVKDRLSKPATGGYRDIMLNGSVGGHVCELQLQVKKLLDFKAQAHVIYGILRSVGWDGDERPIALRPEPAASAAAPSSKAAASDASGGAAVVEEPKASEPNYSGLLHKRGRHVRTNWKQRYFEIQGSEVLYYARKGDDAPKGRIPLRGATVIGWRTGSVAGHDSEFAVVTHSGEQYPLRAHTPVARKKWELELKKAIGQAT